MRLLLDSHIFLWYADGNILEHSLRQIVEARVQELIQDADEVFVSAASIWELTIKNRKGKLVVERPLLELASACGLKVLAVTAQHSEGILALPQIHRDPFDHLLLSQAKVEGLTLVTYDRTLTEYGVPVLLV